MAFVLFNTSLGDMTIPGGVSGSALAAEFVLGASGDILILGGALFQAFSFVFSIF